MLRREEGHHEQHEQQRLAHEMEMTMLRAGGSQVTLLEGNGTTHPTDYDAVDCPDSFRRGLRPPRFIRVPDRTDRS